MATIPIQIVEWIVEALAAFYWFKSARTSIAPKYEGAKGVVQSAGRMNQTLSDFLQYLNSQLQRPACLNAVAACLTGAAIILDIVRQVASAHH